MDAIVIFIWMSVCTMAITIGMIVIFGIVRLLEGYTLKEYAKEVYRFMVPSEEELY